MQKSNVDFYPVLLLSILADTLLRLHTGYWARAGLLALPASAAVLAAVLLLVSTSWQGNALLQKVLCVLLAISSALEILRLHALFGSVYPGTLGLAGTCFVVLAPVIYLRREPALRQTANALLVFGAACMAIMVLSVAPRLRVPNLHAAPLTGQDWQAAFVSQLALPPEYLLFALWPPQPGQRCRKAVTFAVSALGFDAAVHLLLELFFGAAMPTRQTPVQGAAQCGELSIFNRLEWLQILLWCMVVTVRLALYLYAMVELWGGRAGAGSAAAGLDRYPLYFGGMALLCAVVIFAMRLMGKRQLGELQPSELVTTFMISNVASICIDEPDLPLLSSLVPILLIAALEILNSTAAYYLPGYAALLFGRPVTVIQDGQIRQDALRHLRMTPGDLMEALRGKDIFDPRQVVWGVVEPSGSISAAQKVADDSPLLPLLVDQEVYPENLAQLGRNEAWLDTDLARRGMRRAEVLAYLGNKESCVVIQKKTAQNGRSEKPESTGGF